MEEPNAKLNNEEVAEEAKEIEKEVKYKIITLQDEEEKGNTNPFIDQVIKELERISEEFKKYSGMINSFQVFRKQRTPAVIMLGFSIGSIMLKNRRKGPHPSMTAASSSSVGTFDTKP